MKIVKLTSEIEGRYQTLFQKGINAIEDFKKDGDYKKFKTILCELVDETPSVSYLDPDILQCYGFEDYEESQWCEFTDEEEEKWCKEMLKREICEISEFTSCRLSIGGSGSILITLFGDAFTELYKR